MADITVLARLMAGATRTINIAANTLVTTSIKVGGAVSNTELTKTILDKLILIYTAADADGTFDTRYTQIADLASIANGEGASTVGIEDVGGYYTGDDVESALQQLGSLLGSGSADNITFDPSGTTFVATNLQDLGEEIDDRIVATEAVANAAIPATEKGANNGVATLDAGGKIPVAQLPSSVMTYEGTWDASTNTPALTNGTGDAGMVYLTSVAGTADFGAGPIDFAVGDWVVYNGSIWEKSTNSNAVVSVNGQTGVVNLDTDDIPEGANLYFTDARARTATIIQAVNNGDTTHAPSSDAVYDALLLKQNADPALDEAITFFQNTDITGAEAEQLTGNINADALHFHSRIAESRNAGEAYTAGLYAVRLAKAADAGFVAGRAYKADNNAASVDNFYAIGLVNPSGSVSTGAALIVTKAGTLTATGHGFTVGEPIFLGTAGALTNTPPTADNIAIVRVGFASDANTIEVQIAVVGVN